MLSINEWCSIHTGLPPEFNMNAFDITEPQWRELFREHNGLHTYENLDKNKGWVCEKGNFRGHGETIKDAELNLIYKLYDVEWLITMYGNVGRTK